MDIKNVKKRIRESTPKINNDGCYICNSKQTQNHHILRVADLADICMENEYFDIRSLYVPRENLCTEHHHKWHALTEDTYIKGLTITPQEIDKYIDLMNEAMVLSEQVPEELLQSYMDLYTDVADTIDKNLELYSNASINREMQIKQQFDEVKEYDYIA